MATIRIDNLSGDTITVYLDGNEYTLTDEEKISIDSLEKGKHSVRIHRTRIPMESTDFHEIDNTDLKAKMERSDSSCHTQLDLTFELDLNSGKAVVTVKTKIKAKQRLGSDIILSGYSVEASGAKIEAFDLIFASKSVKKKFISHHIKDAFLPVGAGGIFLLIMGLIAFIQNLMGKTVNIGGQSITLPWSIGLLAVALGFVGYTVAAVVYILKTAKNFNEK